MKKLQNPTNFFFKQAQHIEDPYQDQIQKFVSKLLNKDTCQLCKQNFDTVLKVPRIMIHCGHTFCTPCLRKFYMNRRVRCPMCLKLVKQIDRIDRLPINHTIYQYLVQKENKKTGNQQAKVQEAKKFIFSQFERVQKQAHLLQNPQKIDPDSGIPFCVFHPDRVEHFYCESHKIAGCRVCIEIGHSKPQCKVIDLYNVEDLSKYVNVLQQRIPIDYYAQQGLIPGNQNNIMLGLNDEQFSDDSQDDDQDLA